MTRRAAIVAVVIMAAVFVLLGVANYQMSKRPHGESPTGICKYKLAILKSAVEQYRVTRKSMPTSIDDLIEAQLVKDNAPERYVVDAQGTIVISDFGRDAGCLLNYPR